MTIWVYNMENKMLINIYCSNCYYVVLFLYLFIRFVLEKNKSAYIVLLTKRFNNMCTCRNWDIIWLWKVNHLGRCWRLSVVIWPLSCFFFGLPATQLFSVFRLNIFFLRTYYIFFIIYYTIFFYFYLILQLIYKLVHENYMS